MLIQTPMYGSEVEQCIKRFRNNPVDTRLRNHQLHRTLFGQWAFSVTGDIRIVYEWMSKTTVRFVAIGRHEVVYKKSS